MELGTQFQHALNAKYGGRDVGEYLSRMPEKHRETARLLMSKARDFDDIISIDSEHSVDLGFGIDIKFIPDLLTKTAIVENKYTTGYYNASMVKKQKQATFYYVCAKKLFGFEAEVYYQIFNHKNKTVELVKVDKKQNDVDELLFWIDDKLHQIQKCYDTGNWVPKKHSGFKCSLGDACPYT